MPPPRGKFPAFEGPGDYDVTSVVHSDTYPEIDPRKADLSGKAVLITGASRGFGRSMVISMAKAGASYIAAAARSDLSSLEKAVEEAAAGAQRPQPKFLPLTLDVTDAAAVEKAASVVDGEFGKLDILINNAGICNKPAKIMESDPEDFWNVMNVNVRAPYLMTRAFLPLILRGDSKYIVFVSSIGAYLVNPGLAAYQASKATLATFTRHVQVEYADQGVTSFSIHPGSSITNIIDPWGGPSQLGDFLPFFVDSTELPADTLVFLTSQKRAWLGGRYINVSWDMPELMAKEKEIVEGNKLVTKLDF